MPIAEKVTEGQDGIGGRHLMLLSDTQAFSHRAQRSMDVQSDEGRTHPVNSISN